MFVYEKKLQYPVKIKIPIPSWQRSSSPSTAGQTPTGYNKPLPYPLSILMIAKKTAAVNLDCGLASILLLPAPPGTLPYL